MTELSSSAETASSERRRLGAAFLRGLNVGLALSGTILIVATFLPLLHPFWPVTAVAEQFALQVLMGAAALGVIAAALRRWRWLGVVAGIACIQLWTIHPYWPSFVTGAKAAIAAPAVGELKVVSLNVWHRGDSYDAVRDYLTASNADIIGLSEVTPRWKTELASLQALYPYSIDCLDRNPRCEEMLLSKHPFLKSASGHINKNLPVIAWGEIAPPGGIGPPLTFAVTHLSWPVVQADLGMSDGSAAATPAITPATTPATTGVPDTIQATQTQNLIDGLRQLGPDLVLMGDFNAAPWSRVQQYLRQQTGLDNQGFLAPSWPSWGIPAIRLPIDHIMTRGTLRLVSFTPGINVGSDHLPVEAIVAVTGQ